MKTHTLRRHASAVAALLLAVLSANPAGADQALAGALNPFVEKQFIAGAVTLVADKDRVLDVTAVGYADRTRKTPMQTDQIFWIASMTKPITAAALMLLVDEGKVRVDDPIEKYLPEFSGMKVAEQPGAEQGSPSKGPHLPKHPILIRNILNHTSGLPFKAPVEVPTLDQRPLSERVSSYAKLTLQFEPDSRYQYSNAGINTAGRIIEVVSGMSYEDFLQKRLLEPLDMGDTTFWPSESQAARVAKSYKPNAGKTEMEETLIAQLRYPLPDKTNRFPMPAGGLFSTASDCAKFCQMLLNDGMWRGQRILSSSAISQMTRRQTAADIPTAYGFGFSLTGETFGHGGAYGTSMTVDPKKGLITIFLIQNAGWLSEESRKIGGVFRIAAEKSFLK